MTFKAVTVEGNCPEHGEWTSFFVVPEHVPSAEFLMGMEGADAFCECYSQPAELHDHLKGIFLSADAIIKGEADRSKAITEFAYWLECAPEEIGG